MSKPYLTIDDLTAHLPILPDWYIQVLEEREKNDCDVCPDNWIEIELVDFDGRPISGEPWFVFMENTNGSAVSPLAGEVDPNLNGGGKTTPARLVLNAAAYVVDIAFGAQTPTTLNLTDMQLGEAYDEQLYIVDTPATYEGPLNIPSNINGAMEAATEALNGVYDARTGGAPGDAIADMLAEVDLALRAALNLYEDLSLTARNDAEAALMMAMQGRSVNAHLRPDIEPYYESAEVIFDDLAVGTFVGPDGVSYADYTGADLRNRHSQSTLDWMAVASMLELTGDWPRYVGTPGRDTGPGVIERILNGIFGMFVSSAEASPRGPGGPRGFLNKLGGMNIRGHGSNPKRNPTGRNGTKAHTQAHSRRQARSQNYVKVKGVIARIGEYFRTHMNPGHGVRNGRISGAHTPSAFKNAVANAGGEFRRVGTHPADARIKTYEYRLPRADGTMRQRWLTKTTHAIPANELRRLQLEALKNALIRHKGNLSTGQGPFVGYTRSGLRMEGHAIPIRNGFEIRTLYFTLG